MPIFHRDVVQGTSEWTALRSGVPTASRFSEILTASGKPSKSAERYLYMLLAERVMGHPCIEQVSMWQQRGTELEAEAVSFYELQRDVTTELIGFVTTDDGMIGASPDRLVGDEGLLEIKCPNESNHLQFALGVGSAYDSYKVQVQGQLWVTGRKFSDLLSWHPEMPPALIHAERDETFIEKLSALVMQFSVLLEAAAADLVKRGWIKVPPAQSYAAPGEGEAALSVGAASPMQSSPAAHLAPGNVGAVEARPASVGQQVGPLHPHDKLKAWQIEMFPHMAALKKEDEKTYYAVMGSEGYEHKNLIPTQEKAREIFRLIRDAINERKAESGKQLQKK